MKKSVFALLILSVLLLPARSFAFNPNYLLSDAELLDAFSLDRNQIQHFLNRGFLGNYYTEDHQGIVRSATDIIWRASQNIGISPKLLLVLLQKEQSLIEDKNPTQNQLDWATGYAVCDACSKNDPAIQRWRGFGKQINSAALQFVEGYMEDIEQAGSTKGAYGPNLEVQIDGQTVRPANAATAALYAYTPHIHGNHNFVKIWNRWFSTAHPTGTLLQVSGQDAVWLIEHDYKRPIRSKSALISRFNPNLIINVSQSQLDNYPEGRPIDFPNYSLLKDNDGAIYLLVDDTLRHIDSMETFRRVGFSLDEVIDISNADAIAYERGLPITSAALYPQGNLLQLEGSGAVFFIQDGKRHAIFDKAVMHARFPNASPQLVMPVVVEQYTEGAPLLLPDGVLVKTPSEATVYTISEGKKRPIPSEAVFLAYGWEWVDVIDVSEAALKQHATGAVIETPTYLESASAEL